MKNRFNRLTSKEWLPFQKSWFRFTEKRDLFRENIRFFCQAENNGSHIYYCGGDGETFAQVAGESGETIIYETDKINTQIQFAVFDFLVTVTDQTTVERYIAIKEEIIFRIKLLFPLLMERRFIVVFIPNIERNGLYYPFAWDLAKSIGQILSLKDEKIACDNFGNTFYALYFRKDENSGGFSQTKQKLIFAFHNFHRSDGLMDVKLSKKWFVLKPQRRVKEEMLHPAKFPEQLVHYFINCFTTEKDKILDPMTGTGSVQLEALRNKRSGYGVELSSQFTDIARFRCMEHFFVSDIESRIENNDARDILDLSFPQMDYVLTSPPYWDILNMKGGKNQKLRKNKSLPMNYSDNQNDLGNITDYNRFLNELTEIYQKVICLLKPGGYFTVVVKNIKKQGKNYPLAWDLALRMQHNLILQSTVFWCQDDISIAPYGYGNTWVSNTFHHYCLNFRKPK